MGKLYYLIQWIIFFTWSILFIDGNQKIKEYKINTAFNKLSIRSMNNTNSTSRYLIQLDDSSEISSKDKEDDQEEKKEEKSTEDKKDDQEEKEEKDSSEDEEDDHKEKSEKNDTEFKTFGQYFKEFIEWIKQQFYKIYDSYIQSIKIQPIRWSELQDLTPFENPYEPIPIQRIKVHGKKAVNLDQLNPLKGLGFIVDKEMFKDPTEMKYINEAVLCVKATSDYKDCRLLIHEVDTSFPYNDIPNTEKLLVYPDEVENMPTYLRMSYSTSKRESDRTGPYHEHVGCFLFFSDKYEAQKIFYKMVFSPRGRPLHIQKKDFEKEIEKQNKKNDDLINKGMDPVYITENMFSIDQFKKQKIGRLEVEIPLIHKKYTCNWNIIELEWQLR